MARATAPGPAARAELAAAGPPWRPGTRPSTGWCPRRSTCRPTWPRPGWRWPRPAGRGCRWPTWGWAGTGPAAGCGSGWRPACRSWPWSPPGPPCPRPGAGSTTSGPPPRGPARRCTTPWSGSLSHGRGRGGDLPRGAARPAPAARLDGAGRRRQLGPVRLLARPADPGHPHPEPGGRGRRRRPGPDRGRGTGRGGRHCRRRARLLLAAPARRQPARPGAGPRRRQQLGVRGRPAGGALGPALTYRSTQRKPMWVVAVSTASPARGGPVAQAVARGAQVRAALDHAAPRDRLLGRADLGARSRCRGGRR